MYTHIYIYTCNLYTNTQNTQIPMLLTHSLAFFFFLPYPLSQLRRAIRKHCGMWEANVFVF